MARLRRQKRGNRVGATMRGAAFVVATHDPARIERLASSKLALA
jgi:hypothetical protein